MYDLQDYVIELHSIEGRNAGTGGIIGHQLICGSRSRSVDKNTSSYIDSDASYFKRRVVTLCSNAT